MKSFSIKNKLIGIASLTIILVGFFFFDKGLSVGLGLLFILTAITFLILHKFGFRNKRIYFLFLIVLAIHLCTTLFMHYADFQPFSGHVGDYSIYQKSAVEISQSFRQGNFSLKSITLKYPDLYTAHYYPVVVGALYALTLPQEIIGLILNVWLVAVSIIFIYFIVLEIGGSEGSAFMVGLIAAIYPSYVFYTGILIKDAIEIFFIVLGLLFLLKTVKKFSWYNFLVLYSALFCATHFRFYIGYALIFSFLLSWFVFSTIDIKRRIVYGIIFIIIIGFIPQFSASQGYYGISSVKMYLNSKMVSFYRQVVYNPAFNKTSTVSSPSCAETPSSAPLSMASPGTTTNTIPSIAPPTTPSCAKIISISSPSLTKTPLTKTPLANTSSTIGFDSSFPVESNMFGYIKSFVYALLGPFPWQVKNLRQSLALFETIPWYIILYVLAYGIIKSLKAKGFIKTLDYYRLTVPLFLFSVIVLGVLSLFINNFGIITRIRIPGFIAILCIASLAFNNNIIFNYLNTTFYKLLLGKVQENL